MATNSRMKHYDTEWNSAALDETLGCMLVNT